MPLLPGFVLTGALVMPEPDLGTTCCFVLILLGLLWMVGMPMRYFAGVVATIGLAITALAVAAPYRLQRLTNFTDPFKDAKGAGYHTVEGLYALASGGLFGVGLGQGTSKYGWVPNANSDFVFAIIGEELGLIGCLAVLALFALLAYVGMRIVRRSADPFVRLACGAATIWLCGQAVINVGYVTGLLPVTGHPAAADLGRRHVAGRDLLRPRHADLVRAPRDRGRHGRPQGRAPRPPHPPRTLGADPGAQALRRAQAARACGARHRPVRRRAGPRPPARPPRARLARRAAAAAPARPRRVAEPWADEPPRRRYASGGRAS